ncbi:MAPEG family protein [Novilysobacter erysipheiresistens]|uniref:MAPEG family protein n=1 Tax=Novilysobacter erysipheiresistens TaxID=1749332 RepID=A0ABU7Z0D3_9GAMM
MTLAIAYWCVLIAAILPLVWSWIAKSSGEKFDNRDPREWLARQHHPRSLRANAAQQNAFEAFAPFAAGVVLAQLANVDPGWIASLSVVFVAARIAHGLLYLGNKATLRSLVWTLGFACVAGLLVLAALHAA